MLSIFSHSRKWTRASWVRARYPNYLTIWDENHVEYPHENATIRYLISFPCIMACIPTETNLFNALLKLQVNYKLIPLFHFEGSAMSYPYYVVSQTKLRGSTPSASIAKKKSLTRSIIDRKLAHRKLTVCDHCLIYFYNFTWKRKHHRLRRSVRSPVL